MMLRFVCSEINFTLILRRQSWGILRWNVPVQETSTAATHVLLGERSSRGKAGFCMIPDTSTLSGDERRSERTRALSSSGIEPE